MEFNRRRIIRIAATDSPADEWTAQQPREATAWGEKPKFLIRDRDGKYGTRFAGFAFQTGRHLFLVCRDERIPRVHEPSSGETISFIGIALSPRRGNTHRRPSGWANPARLHEKRLIG